MKSGKCQYGEYCALAHSDLELKIKPLHLLPVNNNFLLFEFKSVFCPFSKLEHDRYTCVYAHNWQDFKRPFFADLKPQMCKAWDKEKEILVYSEGILLPCLFKNIYNKFFQWILLFNLFYMLLCVIAQGVRRDSIVITVTDGKNWSTMP